MGTAVLTAGMLGVVPAAPASARPSALHGLAAAGTPFAQAQFAGYATGSELHLGAVTLGSTTLAGVEQAFSGASANSGGLSTGINSVVQPPAIVQPPLSSSVNAYGRGSGLEVGLGTTPAVANQLKLGIAEAQAPPTGPLVTKTVVPINLPGVLTAGVLKGEASAAYNSTFCPVGQPLAFGEGDAAGVGLLGSNPPVVSTTGTGAQSTQDAQSRSRTDLVANADGTFGMASETQQIIAPISINLGATASLQITVQGNGINSPITLTTATDGEGHTGFQLVNTATLVINLVVAGVTTPVANVALNSIVGPNGLVIDTNSLPLVGPILNTLGVNLHLGISAPPRVILSGSNSLAMAYDLISLHLGLTGGIQIANVNVGHMEAGVALPNGPIACTIPVAKNANPATVAAGGTFTWNISIPSSAAALDDSTCDLTNLAATDVVGVSSGSPTFNITGISNGGSFNAATHTITWTGLGTYHHGDPPIVLTVTVSVPQGSAAGVLMDTANVTGGLGNCTGGVSGQASLIGANVTNAVLTGTITLIAPQVGTGGTPGLAATGTGPVLPWIAVGLLVLAEGTRRLVRRTRRAQPVT